MRSLWLFFVALFAVCLACAAQGNLVSATPPTYPLEARAQGIDGAVKLHAVILKDGSVSNLKVISGPPELRQAAVDAVMHWRYHPYLKDGQPVDVDTTVTVNFNLGSGKKKAEAIAKAQAELAQKAAQQSTQPPQEENR